MLEVFLKFASFFWSPFLKVSQVNEQFQIDPAQVQTTAAALCAESKMVAQRMLNHYVKVQGLQISQVCDMLEPLVFYSVLKLRKGKRLSVEVERSFWGMGRVFQGLLDYRVENGRNVGGVGKSKVFWKRV